MSRQEHASQLLAAKDAGFEVEYKSRLHSLQKVALRWVRGDVPIPIVHYELLKRLWLEFFANDMNSICPYRDPAPDRLEFKIPALWEVKDRSDFNDIFAERQKYQAAHGQSRLMPEEYDPIEQYFGGFGPPPCLDPTIPSLPRPRGPRPPPNLPDLDYSTSAPTTPTTSPSTIPIPIRPHNTDPRATEWQGGLKDEYQTPEEKSEEMRRDIEWLSLINAQYSGVDTKNMLQRHLETVAAGKKDEKERDSTSARPKTWEEFPYGGTSTTPSKVVGGGSTEGS